MRTAVSASDALRAFEERLAGFDDPAVFISVGDHDHLASIAATIDAADEDTVPLRGLVFAVKDNIDVAGMPTTVGCPGLASVPATSAAVVERLVRVGALPVAKTNLDQFATGLVGTRSPYGTPANPLDPTLVPGGSSSGSAVAVAAGLVDFALGTDTAGSGRVPAAMCAVVGLKPTFGRLPCTGVVPAMRSADCVSILARTTAEAARVMYAGAGVDAGDSWSRHPAEVGPDRSPMRVGVIDRASLEELSCSRDVLDAYQVIVDRLTADPRVETVTLALKNLLAVGDLLYGGAFVAERTSAVGHIIADGGEGLDPVVAAIIGEGSRYGAVDVYESLYRLHDLRAVVECELAGLDAFVTPAVPRAVSIADVERSPRSVNTEQGRFTTFANLLDLCALTVPVRSGSRPPRPAEAVTFYAQAWREATLERIAPIASSGAVAPPSVGHRLVVAGAHLRGQPLAHQLEELGAAWEQTTHTAPTYRLYAMPGGPPHKPALVHDRDGARIEVDVWRIDSAGLGRFMQMIPAPLGLGHVTLADGSETVGFIAEPRAIAGAVDITHLGGWRRYVSDTD